MSPLKSHFKSVIISNEEYPDKIIDIPPSYIKIATITDHEDYVTVSWIEPVRDWKYWILFIIEATSEIICIILLIMLFWFYAVDVMQFKGVI